MFKKKPETDNNVFVLTLPLLYTSWQRDKLDRLFQCYNNVKNALINQKKKALKQLERDKRYRQNQRSLSEILEELKEAKGKDRIMELNAKKKELCSIRNELILSYGLDDRSFEKDIHRLQHHYSIVMSNEAAKMSYNVRDMFKDYLYGKGKSVRFSPINKLYSISGKTNTGLVCYRDNEVLIGRKKNPMRLRVKLSRNDAYELECLQHPIHYTSLIRRPVNDGWRYFIQLTLGGKPPNKYKTGTGRVGIDIGTQTIAVSSGTKTLLTVLAEKVQDIHRVRRKIERAMDRSRRNTNPLFFDEKGRIVPINQLPPELVRNGKRKWYESKRYSRLKKKRRALFFKEKLLRILSHNTLANQILQLGDVFYIETMNFRALAKRTKEDKLSKKGKHLSKKRFGKSIANKAPATFVAILKQKAESRGGQFYEIATWKAKASQFDHTSQAYKKKSLGTRWTILKNGDKVQRDLYSSFLIQCTNDTLDGFNQELLNSTYNLFKQHHDKTISELLNSDIVYPSSMGLNKKKPA